MSFQDLNIARILEELDEQYCVVIDKHEQISTVQTQTPLRPKKCCLEVCKKKLFLSDFQCKCTKIYCSAHRAPEVHSCTFDFKKLGNDELTKRIGSAVVGNKVDRI